MPQFIISPVQMAEFYQNLCRGRQEPKEILCGPKTYQEFRDLVLKHPAWKYHRCVNPIRFNGAEVKISAMVPEGVLRFVNPDSDDPRYSGDLTLSNTKDRKKARKA